jgi:hypothetical protein
LLHHAAADHDVCASFAGEDRLAPGLARGRGGPAGGGFPTVSLALRAVAYGAGLVGPRLDGAAGRSGWTERLDGYVQTAARSAAVD